MFYVSAFTYKSFEIKGMFTMYVCNPNLKID